MFTDVEGSTELLRRLRDDYGPVLSLHQRLIRGAVDRHRGVEVDTQGDAFFFAFRSASDGIRAAIDAQRALAKQEWTAGVTVRVRMGLHTGEALLDDGRYHGLSVHRAARIAGVANGGQVLVSDSTRSLVADEEELSEVGFRDLGPLRLKDFDRPIRVYRLTAPGVLGSDRPPRARPQTRWRRLAIVACAAVLAIGAAVALAIRQSGGSAAVNVSINSVAVVDLASGKTREAIPVGRDPNSIVVDSSAAWVANGGSGTVTRIDASTRATSTIGGFQSSPFQLASGAAQVWATEDTAGLATVNVTTQTASNPVPLLAPSGLTYSARAIAYGYGSLWVGGGLPTGLVLLKIDPSSQRIVRSVRVGPFARHAIAVGEGGVWVSDQLANTVTEFDPKTLHVLRRVTVGGPTAITLGGGSLWVCGAADKGVWRLPARSGFHSRTLIPTGGQPVAIAAGLKAIWTAVANGTLAKIDPLSNTARLTRIASTLNGIAVGQGAVWAQAGPVSFL